MIDGNWIDWFLGNNPPGPIGVTQLSKWDISEPTRGVGAGITLGTLPDTGFSWNARVTFIVLIPGPVLILNGDGSFVSKGKGFDVKGSLSVMITFDGNAMTLSAAVGAQVGRDPVFAIQGAAAAFFDFNHPDDWYLYIGTKERPLQGKVLSIFEATAYLELSSPQFRFGTTAGLDQKYQYGPLSAHARAKLGAEAEVIRRPTRMTGSAYLDGLLELNAFGLGVAVGLLALVDADVVGATAVQPMSWKVHFAVDAYLSVNLLIKTVKVGGRIEQTYTGGDVAALTAPPLPLVALSIEHAFTSETWPLEITPARNADGLYDGASPGTPATADPLVPLDGQPTLVFGMPINDATSLAQNKPVAIPAVHIGNADYTFTLDEVTIERVDSSGATVFAGTLTGKWCEETTKTRLQLFADTPYFLSRLTLPFTRLADHEALRNPPPCASLPVPAKLRLRQRRLAPLDRLPPQIGAVEFEQIKGVQEHPVIIAPVAQCLEHCHAVVIAADRLAIDQAGANHERRDRRHARAAALEPRISHAQRVRGSRSKTSAPPGNGPGRCGTWGLRAPARC